MLTNTKYKDLKVGDVIVHKSGGSLEVTNIQPVLYPSGKASERTVLMSFYGECSGKGSCKHAYRDEVSLESNCDVLTVED